MITCKKLSILGILLSFTSINSGQSVETLDGITGKAIIANDLINEITNQIEGLKLK